jgi:integrase
MLPTSPKAKRSRVRLTDRIGLGIKLSADVDDEITWDTEVPGFGLRLRRNPDGSLARRWVIQYRVPPRRTRRQGLGNPAVVLCTAARHKARTILARVQLGEDPQAERIASQRALTFGALAEDYLDWIAGRVRRSTLSARRRYLRLHAKALHPLPAAAISHTRLESLLEDVARERGAVAANRCGAVLSACFARAVVAHGLAANPMVGIKPTDEASRDRVLTDEELAVIWRETAGGSDFDRITRLLVLTACRREEIGRMKWEEISGGVFTLPPSRSKNAVQHEVHLTALAAAQLPPRPGDGGAVFGRTGKGFSGWSLPKQRLDKRLGIGAWRLHDLRRSVATWLSENGVPADHVDAVLGHKGAAKKGVRGVYNRALLAEPKRRALALWADHVAAIAGVDMTNVAALTAAD